MRVPNAGQDLIERRIVREGKRVAEAMLAGFAEPRGLTILDVYRHAGERLLMALRGLAVRY
jgi:hypothetical protein